MKISLVVPNVSSHLHGETFEPLGVLYLAAMIRGAHAVQIVDAFNRRLDLDATVEEVAGFAPDLVGLSLTMSPTAPFAKRLARRLRERNPRIRVVAGGTHATFAARELASDPSIDMVVLHEGEATFASLVACLDQGDDPGSIPGLVMRRGEHLVETDLGPAVQDLDHLPFPARDLLPFPDLYRRRHILSSRGCVFRCIYCASSAMNRYRWRPRTPAAVLDEVEEVTAQFGRRFYFADDNFPVDRKRAIRICDGLRERGLDAEWSCLARPELLDHEPLLQAMAASGCQQVFLGAESGSERVLRAMNRRYTGDDLVRIVGRCRTLGIEVTVSFIIGSPWEELSDVQRTFDLARRLPTPHVAFHMFTPYVGTQAFETPGRYGLTILRGDPESFDKNSEPVIRTRHLSNAQIMDLYCQSFGLSMKKARQQLWA